MTVDATFKKKLLFNPGGDDSIDKRRIIKGNSTNLFNLNELKYSWTKSLYRVMLANFWIPEKVDLSNDIQEYNKLSEAEKNIFESIISFLTFLDSIQTNNIPKIADYITAPEVNTLLAIQDFQEVIHSQSYAYILESVIPVERRKRVYELWRENEVLLQRNQYIANIYQKFIDQPSDQSFAKVLIANYILESLYFYNGFIFFYNLAHRNIMLGTADEIRYINRDELSHVELFINIIKSINEENPGFISQALVHELFAVATEQEINWMNFILKDYVLGIDKKSTEQYTRYLTNKRITDLGFEPLYKDNFSNPYSHLEFLSDQKGESIKSNFFEATVTNYSQAVAVEGWDEI